MSRSIAKRLFAPILEVVESYDHSYGMATSNGWLWPGAAVHQWPVQSSEITFDSLPAPNLAGSLCAACPYRTHDKSVGNGCYQERGHALGLGARVCSTAKIGRTQAAEAPVPNSRATALIAQP